MGRGSILVNSRTTSDTTSKLDKADKVNDEPFYTWEQIRKSDNKWIVIDDVIYDVANFSKVHPGGERLLMDHVKQDVTDAFYTFHLDLKHVSKYFKAIRVGKLLISQEEREKQADYELTQEFRRLKVIAEKMNLFEASWLYYGLQFGIMVALELFAMFIINYPGHFTWPTFLLAVVAIGIAYSQAGWIEHDSGHYAIFKTKFYNRIVQRLSATMVMGILPDWWNDHHATHHAKPNVFNKDATLISLTGSTTENGKQANLSNIFILGKVIPRDLGKNKSGTMMYRFQHYVFVFGVSTLYVPLLVIYENLVLLYKRKDYRDLLWHAAFFAKFYFGYGNVLSIKQWFFFFYLAGILGVTIFTWVTQSTHIPTGHVHFDKELSWFRSQVITACNYKPSMLVNWFTGHNTYQIEHHLFPSMPRHNLYYIQPYVKSLCQKYDIYYSEKSLKEAFVDCYKAFRDSGEIWYKAYQEAINI